MDLSILVNMVRIQRDLDKLQEGSESKIKFSANSSIVLRGNFRPSPT